MKDKLFTKLLTIGLPLVLVACIFNGCVTSIPVTYTEPARLNMSGISKIGIDSSDGDVTSKLSSRLATKYAIASAAELQEWKAWRVNAEFQSGAAEVKSAELGSAYAANVARADNTYKDKVLKTSGVVKEVDQTPSGDYFVRLDAGNNNVVALYFISSEKSKMASFNKGQTITVVGKCIGRTPPDSGDTAEILRILGGVQPVNLIEARFPVGDYPGTMDAVLTVTKDVEVKDTTETRKERQAAGTDADGKTIYQDVVVTYYIRSGKLNILYGLVRSRDFSKIGDGGTKQTDLQTARDQDRSKLPNAADMVSRVIDKPIGELAAEMVPTQRTISVTLAKEKDNKEAKKAMGEAEKQVKEKNYKAAAKAYGKIYAQHKNFAAGYNQAILTEGSEGTAAAIVLMEALVKQTNEDLAKTTLAEMRKRDAANQAAARQMAQ